MLSKASAINYILVALSLLHTQPAKAAEFTQLGTCSVLLEGAIIPGDARRLQDFTNAIGCPSLWRGELYLDSSGGALSEVLEIAQDLYNVTTVIDDNAQCLSTCTLIFMAGRICSGAPFQCAPSRKMHWNGNIGFHDPFHGRTDEGQIIPDDTSLYLPKEALSELLHLYSALNAQVQQTGSDQYALPPDLLTILLTTPPEQVYIIQNNDQFFAFNIGIIDNTAPALRPPLSRDRILTMCNHLLFYEFRGWSYIGSPTDISNFPFEVDPETVMNLFAMTRTGLVDLLSENDYAVREPHNAEYFLELRDVNMGRYVSGWCHIETSSWLNGYYDVSFYSSTAANRADISREDLLDIIGQRQSGSASISRLMHYSMGYPLATTIRTVISGQADALDTPPPPITIDRNAR